MHTVSTPDDIKGMMSKIESNDEDIPEIKSNGVELKINRCFKSLDVVDISGKIVASYSQGSDEELFFPEKGIYIVKIDTGKRCITRKIII